MSAAPRRRAPMLWAPTMHGEQEDTRFEDHPPWEAVVNEPALNPSQPNISLAGLAAQSGPPPAPPRRMPKGTTPAPIAASPMPAPMPMAMPMPSAALPVTPGRFYSYAESCAQQLDTTAPVAPLPFAELITASVPRQVPRWSRIAMPIGGVVAVIVFAVAFFASRDHRPELPSIASVSRTETPAVAAAAAPAPAAIPADSHWKPRAVVPTIAAEAPRAEPEVAPTASIDAAIDAATQTRTVEPVAVDKPVVAKTIHTPKKRVAAVTPKKVQRIAPASGKGRRVKVDTSSALGSLRPKKAW